MGYIFAGLKRGRAGAPWNGPPLVFAPPFGSGVEPLAVSEKQSHHEATLIFCEVLASWKWANFVEQQAQASNRVAYINMDETMVRLWQGG